MEDVLQACVCVRVCAAPRLPWQDQLCIVATVDISVHRLCLDNGDLLDSGVWQLNIQAPTALHLLGVLTHVLTDVSNCEAAEVLRI